MVQKQPSKYTGNLLVNTRTITSAKGLFERIENGWAQDCCIKVSELADLLVLLEAIAASRTTVYDGTVPSEQLEAVAEAEQKLETRIGDPNVFTAVQPTTAHEKLKLCQGGINQASLIIRDRLSHIGESGASWLRDLKDVVPLNIRSADRFRKAILSAPSDEGEAAEFALELMNKNFNGAKCAAAIVAMPERYDFWRLRRQPLLREQIVSILERLNDDELIYFVPSLMNPFRANYANTLGAEYAGAAQFAGPELDDVKSQQIFVFASFVAARISEIHSREAINEEILAERLHEARQFPFLGLLCLVGGVDGDPWSVFATALSDRNTLLSEFLSKKGGEYRYIHNFSASQLDDFKRARLEKYYSSMGKRIAWMEQSMKYSEWRDMAAPLDEMMPPIANAGLSAVDATVDLFGGLAKAVPNKQQLNFALSKVIMGGKGELFEYYTFTNRIRGRIDTLMSSGDSGRIIADLVKRKLGLELVQ